MTPREPSQRELDAIERCRLLSDAYSTGADWPGFELLRDFLTDRRRSHLLGESGDKPTPADRRLSLTFFTIEAMDQLSDLVPTLESRRAAAIAAAERESEVAEEWKRLGQATPAIPAPQEYADPIMHLGPEAASLVTDRRDGMRTPTHAVGYLEFWRAPSTWGIRVPAYNRNADSLERFHPSARTLGEFDRHPTITEVETAYFHHFDREARRAALPYGLGDPRSRDALTFAISLTHEAEHGGPLAPTVEKALKPSKSDGRDLSGNELHRVFALALAGLRADVRKTVVRFGSFDLVRVAAILQQEVVDSPRDNPEWLPVLVELGFGLPTGKNDQLRTPYDREMLRLFSPPTATMAKTLRSFLPVGSPRAIEKKQEDVGLALNQGRLRDDLVVIGVRNEMLDGFHRELLKNEQLDRVRSYDLNAVQKALQGLLGGRLRTIFGKLDKRPYEVTGLSPETIDELLLPDASVPERDPQLEHERLVYRATTSKAALTREDLAVADRSPIPVTRPSWAGTAPVIHPKEGEWADSFLEIVPRHRMLWQQLRARLSHGELALSTGQLLQLKALDSFVVWLNARRNALEGTIQTEALAIQDRMRRSDTARGAELPPELHDLPMLGDVYPTMADAIAEWASLENSQDATTPAKLLKGALLVIYTSEVWPRALSGDTQNSAAPLGQPSTRETARIVGMENFAEIVPLFLMQYFTFPAPNASPSAGQR